MCRDRATLNTERLEKRCKRRNPDICNKQYLELRYVISNKQIYIRFDTDSTVLLNSNKNSTDSTLKFEQQNFLLTLTNSRAHQLIE